LGWDPGLVLFRKDTLERISRGEVDVAFRRWKRPMVKAGGTLRTAVGVLAIESVEAIADSAVAAEDAARAGFESSAAMLEAFPPADGRRLYRVRFRLAGPDPRIALRARVELSRDEIDDIRTRLERMDRASRIGPWTRAALELIERRPEVRAGDLAQHLKQERLPFKANVRKLKALGLTESLPVGYRLSPRGRAYLERTQPPTPV
jgi:hypothetical protein